MSSPDLAASADSTLVGSFEDSTQSLEPSTPLRRGRNRRRGSFTAETFADPPNTLLDFAVEGVDPPHVVGPDPPKTTQAWLRRRLRVQGGEGGILPGDDTCPAETMVVVETAQQRREAHVAEQRRRCLENGCYVVQPRRVSRSVERPPTAARKSIK